MAIFATQLYELIALSVILCRFFLFYYQSKVLVSLDKCKQRDLKDWIEQKHGKTKEGYDVQNLARKRAQIGKQIWESHGKLFDKDFPVVKSSTLMFLFITSLGEREM